MNYIDLREFLDSEFMWSSIMRVTLQIGSLDAFTEKKVI